MSDAVGPALDLETLRLEDDARRNGDTLRGLVDDRTDESVWSKTTSRESSKQSHSRPGHLFTGSAGSQNMRSVSMTCPQRGPAPRHNAKTRAGLLMTLFPDGIRPTGKVGSHTGRVQGNPENSVPRPRAIYNSWRRFQGLPGPSAPFLTASRGAPGHLIRGSRSRPARRPSTASSQAMYTMRAPPSRVRRRCTHGAASSTYTARRRSSQSRSLVRNLGGRAPERRKSWTPSPS